MSGISPHFPRLAPWVGLLFLLAPAMPLPAEEATPVRSFRDFDRSTQSLLPASTVMDLYQDERGVLWIATLDGLAQFDGESLEGVRAEDAPRTGALRSIAARPSGGFYVGGSSKLFVFDQQNWHALAADDGVENLATRGDEIWRLDRRGRLHRLVDEKPPWIQVELPEAGTIGVALAARGEQLYLATQNRVYRREHESWVAAGSPIANIAGTQAAIPPTLTALLVAGDGSLWAGSESPFLFTLAAGAETWRALPLPSWRGGRVRALEEDQRGRIWAGGLQGGLAFGRDSFEVWTEENGLHKDGILALLADREGSLWIALNGHGLQQWLGESWTHRNRWRGDDAASQPRQPVFGISEGAEGAFYAAVFTRGIWHFDGRQMHQYGRELGLSEDVRYAYEPAKGQLWVGARCGIFERRADGRFEQTLELPSGFVYAFVPGPSGRQFALTSAFGVYERKPEGWLPVEEWNSRLPSTNVRALLFRSDSTVWIGTLGGLRVFAADGGLLAPGASWASVPEAINALLEYRGEVWIAGFGALAICDLPGSACRNVDLSQLPGNTFYSLAKAPDGALWLGGSAGVGRFRDGQWTHFGTRSGLIEDECNHFGLLARPNGEVLVGTMASLARFGPQNESAVSPKLKPYWLESPNAAAADSPTAGIVRLPAGQRSLRLRWQAPWLLPRTLEYRVRIERLQEGWQAPQKESFRLLENLGPGEWEVEVQARELPAGAWTEPISSRFEIAPHLLETNFFRLFCAALLLFAVAGLVRLRTLRLERRARELHAAVEKHVASLKTLHGLLPICASCKKIRDDHGYWQQLESFLRQNSEAELSHGLCPDCFNSIASALDESEQQHKKAARDEKAAAP